MSSTHIVIPTEGGQVYVAGPNSSGQLSLGTLTQTNTFSFAKLDATTNLTSVLMAADGSAHSLFLRSIGSVYASGLNSNGQLGLGTTADASFAALVQQSAGVDLSNVASVAAGGAHSVFLLSGGTAFSCGLNVNGQLGDGTTTQRTNPVAMNTAVSTPITGVGFIAAGDYHSLLMKTDGTVFGAGLNGNGQLGLGTVVDATYLQQMKTGAAVNLTGVSQIACGGRHSLALTGAGTVYACGAGAGGQLALGTTTDATYATLCLSAAATTLTGIIQVAAGAAHSLFLKSDGTVLACGSNSVGQLGDGTTVDKSYPVAVLTGVSTPLTGIAAVHATANQSYFLSRDGYIYACGFGGTGAFGVGTTTNSSYAVIVITPAGSLLKTAGYSANYARRKGATVANLVTAGYTTLEIVCAGYSKAELLAGGLSVAVMQAAGASYKQLAFAGYSNTELVAAGYTSPTFTIGTLDGIL